MAGVIIIGSIICFSIVAMYILFWLGIMCTEWNDDWDKEHRLRLEAEATADLLRKQMKAANVALNAHKYRDGVH